MTQAMQSGWSKRPGRTPLAVPSEDDRPGTPGLLRLVAMMLVLPVAISALSYGIALLIGAPISANPIHVMLGALSRIAVPGTRADSWDPMMRALEFVHHSGTALYDALFFRLHEKFQYAPTSLLWLEVLKPFMTVDAVSLNRLNGVLFALNAFGCVLVLKRMTADPVASAVLGRIDVWTMILVFALAYTFWPTLYGLYVGQIQVWIDLLFTYALLSWMHGRKLVCGVLIGLACTIKPQLGLLLLWGICWRERNFVLGVAATLLLLGVASVMRYGLADHVNYLDVLSYISRHGESFHANQSINGLMNRLLFLGNNVEWEQNSFPPANPIVHVATLVTSIAFMVLPLWLAFRARNRHAALLDLCIAALCFTMASPIAWEHHYGIALPIYLITFVLAFTRQFAVKRSTLIVCVLISWLLVGSDLQVLDVLSATRLNILQAYVLFGMLLLLPMLVVMAEETRPLRAGETEAWRQPAAIDGGSLSGKAV